MNISEFDKIDKTIKKEQNQSKGSVLKNTGFGIVNSIPQTLLSIPTIIEGVGRAAIGAGQAAFDDNLSLKEGLLKGITDNKSLQAMDYVDTKLRDAFNIPEYEDADRTQQIEEFTGEMLPIFATGGSYGLINIGRKAAMKAARKAAKKAAMKQLSKEAKKQAIKKAVNRTNLGMALIAPGVQVTKNASKLQKGVELGLQVGLPLTINEINKSISDKPGILFDYTEEEPNENIQTLELKLRKNAAKDKINYMDVDLNKPVESFDDKVKQYIKTGVEIAAPIAAIGAFRNTKLAKKIIQNIKNEKIAQQNAVKFSETLSPMEKVLNAVDTKNIAETAFNKGIIDEKMLNNLYRNTYSQTNNAFETGTLYLGDNIIQTNKAPTLVLRDVQTIGAQNPREFDTFNGFMNKTRQLQAKIYEYNQTHNTNYGLDDLLAKPQLMVSIQAPGNKPLAELYKEIKFLYKQVQKDGKFTEVLQNISDINNKMLDIGVQTGEFSEQFAASLKKNRDFGGLNTYLPGIFEQDLPTGLRKVVQFIDKFTGGTDLYKKAKTFAAKKRLDNRTLLNAVPWDQSFAKEYKTTLKSLLDNKIKRDLVQNMQEIQKQKIINSINKIQNLQETVTSKNAEKIAEQIDDLSQKVTEEFDNIKFLGIDDTASEKLITNKNPLFNLLNKTEKDASTLEKSLNLPITNEYKNLTDAIANELTDPSIIVIPYDNTKMYYKVDKFLGQMVQDNPQNANLFMSTMRNVSKFAKQFITGKYNPFFSPITSAYTASDQIMGLKSMNKFLPNKIKASDINYKQGYVDAFNYKNTVRQLNKIYKNLEAGKLQRTPEVLKKIDDLEQTIRNSDINKLKATGANLQGRYPIDVYQRKSNNFNNEQGFIVNSPKTLKKLTDVIKQSKLTNNALIDASQTGLSWVNYGLTSLRDAPTLGLYKALNKNFLKTDGTIDANKVLSVSRLFDRYTATGNVTPSQSKLGKTVQAINDVSLYFSDMLSENLARGRQTGFGNVTKHLTNLIDANVPLQQELKSIGKGIVANDFIKAGVTLVTIPTVLASIWNHSSAENEAAYDALPDAYKSKGIVFANVVNGKPVVIPLTQSLMWLVTPLRERITDPLLRKNENAYNRSQSFGNAMKDTAKINWGVSMPPLLAAGLNMLGYRSPQTNELVERGVTNEHAFEGLELRNLDNGSDTYYSEGIFGPKTRAVAQSLFGNIGSAVTEAIDITAARGSLTQGLEAGLNRATTTLTNLINPKASTWSATSANLYKKEQNYKKATRNDNLTTEQQKVLLIIKQYHNTYLNKTQQEIKNIRKQITELRNTGKTSEGVKVSYNKAQDNINDLTKQIKLLQSDQVKQYETLDKLLKQHFNTTYDEFMEGIK